MYKIIPAQSFERNAKPLLKKYPSLREELYELGEQLSRNPMQGTPLGKSCYKVRLAIKSKGKGKSGGARVVTYVITENQEVILLTIYDKQVKADLEPNELDTLLESLD
jgi:mRNA-degrading endonuclease RelE of RelBE toxin-antitoxin system